MRAMAYKLFSYLKTHPLITAISVLLLFTLPIFHLLIFFWPLIVSTLLGVLAVISFGGPSDEHTTPIAGRAPVESAWQQPDVITLPSHEENFSNVLMVGNQEVTWLEWLHNEDTRKLCDHECVWDAYGCDGSIMASQAIVVDGASRATIGASNGSTRKDEAIDDASLQAKDKARLYACGSRGEGETHVSTAIVLEEEETKLNVPILTAEDASNLDSTGEDHMCITFIGNRESKTNATSAGGDEVAGILEAFNECNVIASSLESHISIESTLSKCVLEGEASLRAAVSTLEQSTEDVSHTSELKVADTHEQDAPDLQFSNKTISPVLELKGAEMRHVAQQNETKRGSNQFETQDPQWDVSDGEEDRSSLRFSFFHNSSRSL